jgi:hypothetical protein
VTVPGPLDLEVVVELTRGRATVLVECEGCGARTSALLVLGANDQTLAEIPICDACQRHLAATGYAVADEAEVHYIRQRQAGRSRELARRVAGKWFAR